MINPKRFNEDLINALINALDVIGGFILTPIVWLTGFVLWVLQLINKLIRKYRLRKLQRNGEISRDTWKGVSSHCFYCGKKGEGPWLFVYEWDADVHESCIDGFLKSPEGLIL